MFDLTLPPPYRGWNSEIAAAVGDSRFAVDMFNWILRAGQMSVRPNPVTHATRANSKVLGFAGYATSATEELWVWCGDQTSPNVSTLHNATAGGAMPAAVVTFTGTYPASRPPGFVSISTGAGRYLFTCIANGPGDPAGVYRYDGATWSSIASFGTLPTAHIRQMALYKQRLFFAEFDSLNIWYLPVNSISGAAVQYPLGALFKRGGVIYDIATWSVDTGTGPDDMLAVMTSQGEVAVFTGTDPSAQFTWSLVGVFNLASPAAYFPLTKVDGDIWVYTTRGILSLSSSLKSTILQKTSELSANISSYMATRATPNGALAASYCCAAYSPREGWFSFNIVDPNQVNPSSVAPHYTLDSAAWQLWGFGGSVTALGVWRGSMYFGIVDSLLAAAIVSIPATGLINSLVNPGGAILTQVVTGSRRPKQQYRLDKLVNRLTVPAGVGGTYSGSVIIGITTDGRQNIPFHVGQIRAQDFQSAPLRSVTDTFGMVKIIGQTFAFDDVPTVEYNGLDLSWTINRGF